jgi:PAS domain S-box-containing protein
MTPRLNILFAEDNPADAELVLRQLRREGFELDVVRVDTEEAFRASLNDKLDLILSDYDLGPFNGLRALEILKQKGLDVPFILISGTIGEDLAVEAIKLGASDYLLKDRLVRLGTAVTQAIMEGRLRRERRRSESALAVSESRYRLLVEQASDGIFTVSPEGRYTDANARGLEMLQYDREEFLTLKLGDLIAAKDRPRLVKEVARLRKGGTRVSDFKLRRKDGTWFDAEISARALPDGQLLGIIRDLTERRRSEQALRESEERFRQLAENIHEVFWMTDPIKRRILYVSPAYEKIWGRSCDSLYETPETWVESVHEEDRERVVAAIQHEASSGYHEIYRVVRPDGALRWVRDRAFPIKDASGRVYRIVGTAEDITERRQLEEQFRQAQKMEAIGTLAGGIAHDFNNILGAIIGYVELTKMNLQGHATSNQYLDLVLQGAHRAAALVRQILAFSRQQDQQRILVQLRHVVEEPLKLLRATVPAIIEFDVSLANDLPVVLADPTQVHQVVMNLCTNAAHAMGGQAGRLGVKLEKLLVDARRPATSVTLKHGLYVVLTVSDTGCGMDRSTLERIFEPFFTTKQPGEGTGLGLAVVHGIMQSHEGALTVESQPGEGTVFRLYFPADNAVIPEKTTSENTDVPLGFGERLLFIDDELPIAQLGKNVLDTLNYETTSVTDATEALDLFRANPQAFDVVITDLSMPKMMGTDLAAQVLAIRPDIPIILTTGYTATLTSDTVQTLGVRELLMKPFSFRSIGLAVRRALTNSQSLPS